MNGFMLYEYGRLPEHQEAVQITYQGFLFEAIDYEDRMISKVRVRKLPEQETEKTE